MPQALSTTASTVSSLTPNNRSTESNYPVRKRETVCRRFEAHAGPKQTHFPRRCWRVRLRPVRRANTRPWSSITPQTSSSSSTPARSHFDGLSNGKRASFPPFFHLIARTKATRQHPCFPSSHEFEWKREECFMIRKPDPPVLVAVTKEPPGRIRSSSVQILDYNLNRCAHLVSCCFPLSAALTWWVRAPIASFDIEDRKGLEIVMLTALLTFQDLSDVYNEPSSTTANTTATAGTPSTSDAPKPKPPPKPTPKKGVERIAELQLGRGQVNEVTVLEEGKVADYAKHCVQLLQASVLPSPSWTPTLLIRGTGRCNAVHQCTLLRSG